MSLARWSFDLAVDLGKHAVLCSNWACSSQTQTAGYLQDIIRTRKSVLRTIAEE